MQVNSAFARMFGGVRHGAAAAAASTPVRVLLAGGVVAAGAALLTACSSQGPRGGADDASSGADDVSDTPKPAPSTGGPSTTTPAPETPATSEFSITGSAKEQGLVRDALAAARGTDAGRSVLDAAAKGDVKFEVLSSAAYDARNGADTLAVARSSWLSYEGQKERLEVKTVIEVDADSLRDGSLASRASTLVHELQHAVDARDPKLTNAQSEALAYTAGDKVQTALGEEPGKEALSRDDRTGKLLTLEEIQRAVCADPIYERMYRADGSWDENCATVTSAVS